MADFVHVRVCKPKCKCEKLLKLRKEPSDAIKRAGAD